MPTIRTTLFLTLAFATNTLAYAEPPKLFRWTDEAGIAHYGDRIPPQYVQKGYKVISEQGITVFTIEPSIASPEMEAMHQNLSTHDRGLLLSFDNIDEIIANRDRKLGDLDSTITLTNDIIQMIQSRLRDLTRQAGDLERNNEPVPADLQTAISSAQTKINEYQKTRAKHQANRDQIARQFDTDIKRYQELTGKKK
jgi:hypothetical protein